MSILNTKSARWVSFYLAFFLIAQPAFAQTTTTTGTGIQKDQSAVTSGGSSDNRTNISVPSLGTTDPGKFNFGSASSQGGFDPTAATQKIKVHVLGDVQNPGIFTMRISDRLSDVLGQSIPKRSSVRIVQIRNPQDATRSFDLYKYYFQGQLGSNPFLRDNDVVFVPAHKGAIRIEGPVSRPGLYELLHEKNIQDAVRLGGGLTNAASKIHPIKVLRFSEQGKQFVLDVENTNRAMRNFKILKGDIVVIPDIINNPKKFDYTVESIPGENLFYPTSTPNVFVLGEVTQSGSYPYKSHLRIKDYISYASPTPRAKLGKAVLIRNGSRTQIAFDERPAPGDIVVVKPKFSVGAIVTTISTAMSLVLTALLLDQTLRNR